jgi:hypothetical protein
MSAAPRPAFVFGPSCSGVTVELRPSRAHQTRDLLVRRKPFQRELGEHGLAVHRDLECSAFRFDQLDFGLGKGALEFSGQTDRLRQVVSLDAVLNRDIHGWIRWS